MLKIDQNKIIQGLLESVKAGNRLTREERRLCVAHLEATELYTDKELASLFRVTPGVISKDREKIREDRASILSVVKPVDFVVDYLDNQKYVLGRLRGIIEDVKTSTKESVMALDKYSLAVQRTMDTLQNLGALPKHLGQITVMEERWVAEIADGGHIVVTDQSLLPEGSLGSFIEPTRITDGTIIPASQESSDEAKQPTQ